VNGGLPRPLRSLRNRLTLIFALIVACAIGIVYFYVAPRLETQLVGQKTTNLEKDLQRWAPALDEATGTDLVEDELDRRVRMAAARSNAEVTILGIVTGTIDEIYSTASSTPDEDAFGAASTPKAVPPPVRDLAIRAVQTRKLVTSTATVDGDRKAFAVQPTIRDGQVRSIAVFADSLAEVQANVSLIRNRILVSGLVALVLAAAAGYWVAFRLTNRIKRLEAGARRLAAGDFSKPVPPVSRDELGQLAAAFGDMQHQLSRLDTSRKQFIASASHELRTPIFSLGGFLELLEDEELDDDERAAFLAQLRGQVDRLSKLATELLDLSRLESGAVELRPEPTDLAVLAREVSAEFGPALAAHRSRLDLKTEPVPIEIECDPERVAQVMRILLDNALVHTPAGTAIIVSTHRRNGHAAVEVADTGLGIGRQTMPHIFEPFFTSADAARGAGLGLAIARELADHMDGRLTVRSTPGSTAFRLTLPAR
jgi:signal transduction histidine kinase